MSDNNKNNNDAPPETLPDSLIVTSPCDGTVIATLTADSEQTLAYKIEKAVAVQEKFHNKTLRPAREKLLIAFSDALNENRQSLADIIVYDAGKTAKEAMAEVVGAIDILKKTIEDATLPDLNGMRRCKDRAPVGVVGLITSFNFPIAVAHWTIAPAILAGNAVLWKASEKAPMVALSVKEIFDKIAGDYADLLQLVVGGKEIGAKLVADERVGMISATGGIEMGYNVKTAINQKKNNATPPILELGGNNCVVISHKVTPEHLEWSVNAVIGSFFASGGQRCTNTRRLFIHIKVYDEVIALLKRRIEDFVASGAIVNPLSGISNDYGYGVLIDEAAFKRLEFAKQNVKKQYGEWHYGNRLLVHESPNVFCVEPALAIMPMQTLIMIEEIFAPLLFIVKYNKFIEAIAMLNAPSNSGLVNAIYTQNSLEAEIFIRHSEAGHTLINPPKGTSTPAFGMGFGGNKNSGEGEILNSADPLQAFTRSRMVRRAAQNISIAMDIG